MSDEEQYTTYGSFSVPTHTDRGEDSEMGTDSMIDDSVPVEQQYQQFHAGMDELGASAKPLYGQVREAMTSSGLLSQRPGQRFQPPARSLPESRFPEGNCCFQYSRNKIRVYLYFLPLIQNSFYSYRGNLGRTGTEAFSPASSQAYCRAYWSAYCQYQWQYKYQRE